ncbi:hypothetical protein G5B00_13075 [Parapedobacter sp. SGR-10]|uniref:immunoglobulin domain-containing protein n=1 Tax=Parapedobacter sp. SGR-10 TaxID=2710879 RepID=UPI0013D69A85|nr:hypothetical protein [Parapedobacter sp. SGR-10]NGF57443.1 hypothetical protein [Parapedobacter sp. SGR-10]
MRIFCGVMLFWIAVQTGYGQRVYADATQISVTPPVLVTLASVENQGRAIDLPDTLNFSTLNVSVGALGIIYARQNLQFINNPKPSRFSPIITKIGRQGSLIDLLGRFKVQRTNGNINNLVEPDYSGSQLLNLLNLFGGGEVGTLVFLPNGDDFDGIRFEVTSFLSAAVSAHYYYAFYIASPTLSNHTIHLCEGASGTATISNFQPGYTYRLYTAQAGGTQVWNDITTNTITIPPDSEGSYWLEAREGNVYPSARVKITVTVHPLPGKPQVTLTDELN